MNALSTQALHATPSHTMRSLMLDEAGSAGQRVALQLAADQDRYQELAEHLIVHLPHGVLTVARGSSDHAAAYLAYLVMSRTGQLVTSLPKSLLTLYQAPVASHGLLAIAVTQSGRSRDLIEPMQVFRAAGAITVALANDVDSPLAQAVQWCLPLHAGPEHSLAATKSFVCSLVASARLCAHWPWGEHHDLLDALQSLPQALEQACREDWSSAVPVLSQAERLMVVGNGPGLVIAQEAVLKLNQTCGVRADAFSSTEVRHGPLALLRPDQPMLVFAPRGPAQAGLLALAQEMRQHGVQVLLAAPPDVPQRQLTLTTTAHHDLDPITAIQSFYLLAEAVSRARGLDPDRPAHVSKVASMR